MPFDNLLIQTCSIMRKSKSLDDYGNQSEVLESFARGIPCRLGTHKQRPYEWQGEKRLAKEKLVVFMRPQPSMTEHDYLQIDGGPLCDIVSIVPVASGTAGNHHWEVQVQAIKP